MGIVDLAFNKAKEKIDEACAHGEISDSERMLSVVAGGFILAFSIKRVFKSPLTAISGLTLGSALLTRGITGNCPIKGALDSNEVVDVDKNITVIEHRHVVK